MDEMKVKLSTKIMRGMAAKLLSKLIFDKTGLKAKIEVNGLQAEMKNGKINFHLNIDGEFDDDALIKINRLIELE